MDIICRYETPGSKIGRTDDNVQLISSLRPESFAALDALTFILHRAHFYNLSIRSEILHIVDNKSVLLRTNDYITGHRLHPNNMLETDFDIQIQLNNRLRELESVTYKITHVKSHQIKNKQHKRKFGDLVLINDATDKLAGHGILRKPIPNFSSPEVNAYLYINGIQIENKLKTSVQQAMGLQQQTEYLKRKYTWSETTMKHIDFLNFTKLAKGLSFYLHKFSAMLVSKQLPVNQIIFSRTKSSSNLCPFLSKKPGNTTALPVL